jgi:hypothetical protein
MKTTISTNTAVGIWLVQLVICIVGFIGYVKCIYKMVDCNWEPVGKAEILYTAGTFTGAGCVIGYFNIEDK